MSLAMSATETGIALSALAHELGPVGVRLEGDGAVRVTDVRQDSRRVARGDLFVARPGASFDGARFAEDARRRGAAAILAEESAVLPRTGLPVLRVRDVGLGLALAAEAVHGHPTERLSVVGITGTNGKTTTCALAAHAIDAAGGRAARLGTLGYAFGDDVVPESLTTPEADELSRFASRALSSGATHLAMEVSSIALVQSRVEALTFAVAAFTNLTQDHLDFHGTMQAYAEAKARLFCERSPRVAVVNVDDPFGRELGRRAAPRVERVLTVGRASDADVRPEGVTVDARGIRGSVVLPSATVTLSSRLVGGHNLENLLVALGIVEALGLDVSRAAYGLSDVLVPGRLERCDGPGDDVTVLVDYAHTPDALERVLSAVRGLRPRAIHCVFGCGGDRDPTKRPKMGRAVALGADRAIVTSDNPRSEDPMDIVRQILPGLEGTGTPFEVIADREAAILRAVVDASPGDVVLIAGKGHEAYQIVGSETRAFDDRQEARRSLRLRREKAG